MFDDNKQASAAAAAEDVSEGQEEVAEVLGGENPAASNGKPNQQTVVIKDDDIHSMPVKFLAGRPQQVAGKTASGAAAPTKGGGGKKILWVFVGLIVFLGVIIGGGLWFINYNKSASDQEVVINQNSNTNDNTNTNDNQNSNTNDNTNTNSNTNDVPPPPPPPPPPTNVLDADNDGLTQLEEGIYFTNSNRDDTDRDGYKDGVEISNLYDPLVPGALLVDSGLVTQYKDSSGYDLLRPKNWVAEGSEENVVILLPDSETGEFFSILAMPNESAWVIDDIFIEMSELLQPRQSYINFSLAGQPALKLVDNLGVLMVTEEYIYVIDYKLGEVEEPNFATTFDMLLNSFSIGEASEDIPSDE